MTGQSQPIQIGDGRGPADGRHGAAIVIDEWRHGLAFQAMANRLRDISTLLNRHRSDTGQCRLRVCRGSYSSQVADDKNLRMTGNGEITANRNSALAIDLHANLL